MMKKVFFGMVLLVTAGVANAQVLSYKNTLKVGILAGASVPKGNTDAGAGVDIAYQNLIRY